MPNPFDQLSLDQLRRRTSVKWRAYSADVLPLFVAEMDLPLARPVRQALYAALERGDTGYPIGDDYARAYDAFARACWGWRIAPERSATVADVMNGIVAALRLVTEPGDPVVVNSPVYTPFYEFVRYADRRVVESPLGADGRLDLDGLDRTFARLREDGARRAAYLLCSPHNPTGTVHTREELAGALEIARRHDVRVVVDEIHAPLVYDADAFTPLLTLPGAEAAFSLVSASKAWNLAGIKAALLVAGDGAADDLARLPDIVRHGPSHLGVIAHVAALRHARDWLGDVLAGLDENRMLLAKLLAEHLPQVRYEPPQGTYLAWLDCRELGLGDDPAAAFLERAKVALVPGPSFGTGGAGHARLNLAAPQAVLEEAVGRMAGVV
jgi:cystathionine beta-lyase